MSDREYDAVPGTAVVLVLIGAALTLAGVAALAILVLL